MWTVQEEREAMSVLSCSRNSCENTMCDRYSYTHGYICSDCFNELVDLGITQNIEEFMDAKKAYPSNEDSAEAYFSSIFPFSEVTHE